jgi:Ca2+-binding RTX toxin-like protein
MHVRREIRSTLRKSAPAFALACAVALGESGCADSSEPHVSPALSQHVLSAPPWQRGEAYAVGELVSADGKIYRCIQAHTSADGWDPQHAPALWGFEAVESEEPTEATTPPPLGLSLDYVTLDADCDDSPASCCQPGSTLHELSAGDDTFYGTTPQRCVLGLSGRDTVHLRSEGPSSLLLGSGDDVAMDGPGDDFIWGGAGSDTINGYGGTNLLFGGFGSDTILAANGKNVVVPGPDADVVALGVGDDTVHIFDVCEVAAGERIDGGSGHDVLFTPVPVEELVELGVQVANFEEFVVRREPCRSQCAAPESCDDGCPENPDPDLEDADAPDATELHHYDWQAARALRDSFSWSDTAALADDSQRIADLAEPPDDPAAVAALLPSLYYVQIYVNHPDHLAELDEIGIHWDMEPFFESELPGGDDDTQCAEDYLMTFEGDPEDAGLFVYALMPAITYNGIREAALSGEETYKAVILRDVPAEARAENGSVSWSYLAGDLLDFAPKHTHLTDAGETDPPPLVEEQDDGVTTKRFGRRLRRWARKVRDVTRKTVDFVRKGLGKLANKLRPSTDLTIQFNVKNRAGQFGTPVRAWDRFGNIAPTYEEVLTLSGTRVNVKQLGGITLFTKSTRDDGSVTVEVPRNRRTRICIEADSNAARMESGLLWPVRYCKKKPIRSKGGSQRIDITVKATEFFALAQIIDARDFAGRALGRSPEKATITTGRMANWLAVEGDDGHERAFVPCLQTPLAPVTTVNAYADAIDILSSPVAPGLGSALEFALTTDIVLPKDAQKSRLVPVHEYGHFVLCEGLYHFQKETFNNVWSQVIAKTVPRENPDAEIVHLNEGFADWFASQVVGGANYFKTADLSTGISGTSASNGDFFFQPDAPGLGLGMEENVGSPGCGTATFSKNCQLSEHFDARAQGVARFATLLHDIIDRGAPSHDLAGDAAVWNFDGTTNRFALRSIKPPAPPFPWSHFNDESVTLPPRALWEAFDKFAKRNGVRGTMLSFESLLPSVTEVLYQWGHDRPAICEMIKLHRDDGDCPTDWVPVEENDGPDLL